MKKIVEYSASELDRATSGLDRNLGSCFERITCPPTIVPGPTLVTFNFRVPCSGIVHHIAIHPAQSRLVSVSINGDLRMAWCDVPPLFSRPYAGWINDWLLVESSIGLQPSSSIAVTVMITEEGEHRMDAWMLLYRVREEIRARV